MRMQTENKDTDIRKLEYGEVWLALQQSVNQKMGNRSKWEEWVTGRMAYAENRRMTLAMTVDCQTGENGDLKNEHTVQSNNAEDEDHGQGHDHNGVDLQSRRLISV